MDELNACTDGSEVNHERAVVARDATAASHACSCWLRRYIHVALVWSSRTLAPRGLGLAVFRVILDSKIVTPIRLRETALAVVSAMVGMVTLPAMCLTLQNIGPAARVVFYDYLPLEEGIIVIAAAILGASLGAQVPRWLRRSQPTAAPRLRPTARLVALGLLMSWLALEHVRAFPASASVAERDAWASARVSKYVALKRVVAAVPEVQRDVGRIVAIAPTARDQHRFAREMNGDDMFFSLDVIGQRGSGLFHVQCTLDEFRVYDWRPGRWLFHGRESQIKHVPDLVPH